MSPSKKNAAARETPGTAPAAATRRTASSDTASLLELIDKLGALLERSDLSELEVQAGETGIVLRKPSAVASAPVQTVSAEHPSHRAPAALASAGPEAAAIDPAMPERSVKTVRAPLTGVFYAASSPTAPPYVSVGQQVSVGQIVGLIEAMKLFNEIKSDVSGKVVRVVAESGKLVKAKSPLIEVEP